MATVKADKAIHISPESRQFQNGSTSKTIPNGDYPIRINPW
jgi:hypothetical protein